MQSLTMKNGDQACREAANYFRKEGIMAILDENQFGLRKMPLDGHLPERLKTPHVTSCVYNGLEATMEAKTKLGEA